MNSPIVSLQNWKKQLKPVFESMMVFEIGPLGCHPAILKIYKLQTKCANEINQMVPFIIASSITWSEN